MQAGPSTLDACLAREACYRVIGEVSPLPEQVNFVSWYRSELQTLLQVSTSPWMVTCAENSLIMSFCALRQPSHWLCIACPPSLSHHLDQMITHACAADNNVRECRKPAAEGAHGYV